MLKEVYPDLIPYVNRAEFPFFILPKLKEVGFNGMLIKEFGGSGLNNLETGIVYYEMAKKDASIALFTVV